MDLDVIRLGIEQGVPFNAHVGLEAVAVDVGHAVVRLPDRPHLRNHIGSQHGSGVFLAAEAASGGAVFAAFGHAMANFTPLAVEGRIEFLRVARGPLEADAVMCADPQKVLEELARGEQARFEVEVEVRDQDQRVVAEAVFGWRLRRNLRPADWTAQAKAGAS